MEYWKEQRRLKEAGLEWEGQKQMKCRLLFGPTAVGKTSHVMIETVGRGIPLYKKKGITNGMKVTQMKHLWSLMNSTLVL